MTFKLDIRGGGNIFIFQYLESRTSQINFWFIFHFGNVFWLFEWRYSWGILLNKFWID